MSWTSHPRLQPLRHRSRIADLVLETIDGYSRHRTGRNASLLAYMGILTVFPLLLAATTVLGLVLEDRPDLQQDILDSFLSQVPVVGASLEENQGMISGNWWALVIGLAGALWGSLRAFLAMQTALDDIWEVTSGRANYVVQRVRAFVGIGVIAVGQLASVVLAALVGQAGLPRVGQVLLTIGGLALNVALLGLMYRYLTARRVTWHMIWPGTLFAAVLFTVLQFAGTNIMASKLNDAEEVYGVFGGLIALAGWISLHGLVALVGAEFNAALERRRQRVGPTASGEATAAIKNAHLGPQVSPHGS